MPVRRTARALTIHDGKLLLMERWRDDLHYFSIPGGGIEAGEESIEAAERELMEETGCTIEVSRLLYWLELPDDTVHYIYLSDYVAGTPQLQPDAPEVLMHDEHNRFKPGWVSLDELPKLSYLVWEPVMRRFIEDLQTSLPEEAIQLV